MLQKYKLKSQWDTTVHFLERLKLERSTVLNINKDMEQLELSYPAGRNIKWSKLGEKFTWSTFMYLFQRKENLNPYKDYEFSLFFYFIFFDYEFS